jgi:hypothetical protein
VLNDEHAFAPMNSRYLMIASALVMAAMGLVLSFAPAETLAYMGGPAAGRLPVILQLTGGLYLGFAFTNWTAKGMVLGGIYGRALVMGNFLHFIMGALTLLRAAVGISNGPVFWTVTLIYVAFATGFGLLLFAHPAKIMGTPEQQAQGG